MSEKVISMKFGGTSVATPERRRLIVEHIEREQRAGHRCALVVSAMGRRGDPYATDTLLDLLRDQGASIDPRNYSFMYVTGEMISAGVMVQTLHLSGHTAVGLTGGAAGIITEDFPLSARVVRLDGARLRRIVADGAIPVVCGSQGITQTDGDFSSLGRGGSDTSGVLVGIMLGAERADIYTDVEYMLAADPRTLPDAPKRARISYVAAHEMARFGAKVVHPGAVRLAMAHNLPLRIRSTFSQAEGTLIDAQPDAVPLVGMPVIPAVQVTALAADVLTPQDRDSLEQHVGLLTLEDVAAGTHILCAPAGDAANQVEHELAKLGITGLQWQPGCSLVSLVGTPDSQIDLDQKALAALAGLDVPYHAQAERRSTFVVSAPDMANALQRLHGALAGYLHGTG